jgi:hypothetical protein
MATITGKVTVQTVGELIDALKAFAPELPVECAAATCVTVYQVVPVYDGEEAYIDICGEDPWDE